MRYRVMTGKIVRVLAICVSLTEVILLLCYYVPLLKQVPWFHLDGVDTKQYDDNYVSDLLFHDSVYKILVTLLVALQLCICSFFVVQLNQRGKKWFGCFVPVMVVELFVLFLAWVGWVIVSSVYLNSDGKSISTGHVVGAGLFISASSVYFLMMIVNVLFLFTDRWSKCEFFVFVLSFAFFAASVVVGSVFATSFFNHEIKFGWAFEHGAFILFAGAHVWLFVVDGWLEEDLDKKTGPPVPPCSSEFVGSVRIRKTDLRL